MHSIIHPSICSFTQSLSALLCSFTVKTGSAFTEPLQYSASHLWVFGLWGQRPSTAELSSTAWHRELSGYLNTALSQNKMIQRGKWWTVINNDSVLPLTLCCTFIVCVLLDKHNIFYQTFHKGGSINILWSFFSFHKCLYALHTDIHVQTLHLSQ